MVKKTKAEGKMILLRPHSKEELGCQLSVFILQNCTAVAVCSLETVPFMYMIMFSNVPNLFVHISR